MVVWLGLSYTHGACTTGAPAAMLAPWTSRHLPEWKATLVPSYRGLCVKVNAWFVWAPPRHGHWPTATPLPTQPPATSTHWPEWRNTRLYPYGTARRETSWWWALPRHGACTRTAPAAVPAPWT